jgi:1-acyl-sn-glycerol-3-phosphate acyltransferase
MLDSLFAWGIITVAKLLTGVQARWVGCGPDDAQRIYFANHTSHLDFILMWSALPAEIRRKTRPVAAGDYWGKDPIRRFLIHKVFHGVLVNRGQQSRTVNPLAPMLEALDQGESLILFPEGTRGSGEAVQEFKSGIYHMAKARPNVDLVPVWLNNSNRVFPKGSILPVPLLCSVIFGQPIRLGADEHRPVFLERLRRSVVDLKAQ